jgi:hypothetical protein
VKVCKPIFYLPRWVSGWPGPQKPINPDLNRRAVLLWRRAD